MADFSPICTYKHAIITCQSKTTLKYIPILSRHLPNSLLIKGEHKQKHSSPHLNMFACPLADSGTPPTPGSAACRAVPAPALSLLLPGYSLQGSTPVPVLLGQSRRETSGCGALNMQQVGNCIAVPPLLCSLSPGEPSLSTPAVQATCATLQMARQSPCCSLPGQYLATQVLGFALAS